MGREKKNFLLPEGFLCANTHTYTQRCKHIYNHNTSNSKMPFRAKSHFISYKRILSKIIFKKKQQFTYS